MRYFLKASQRASEFLINLRLLSNRLKCWDCKELIITDNGTAIKPYTGISFYLNKIFKLKDRYICSECFKTLNRNNKLKKLI